MRAERGSVVEAVAPVSTFRPAAARASSIATLSCDRMPVDAVRIPTAPAAPGRSLSARNDSVCDRSTRAVSGPSRLSDPDPGAQQLIAQAPGCAIAL